MDIDGLRYDGTWYESGIAIGVDPTLLDATSNDDRASWCAQVSVVSGGGEPGTPGLPNDPCTE
jgi:hypothetical protein